MPLPGYKLKVVDDEGGEVARGEVGELVVKGPGVMRGYHGKREATDEALTADGWLRTGDLARAPARSGCVEFAGRKKDVIKHGGYSVFAVEVEAALGEHPAVAEAAVVGLPDERKGEVPVAAVILRDGAHAHRGRAGGVGRRAAQRLQGAAPGPVRRRAAAHRHRQGPEGRAQEAVRRRWCDVTHAGS